MPLYPSAEWALQSATVVVWPHLQSDWGPYLASSQDNAIERHYRSLCEQIAIYQQIIVIAYDAAHQQHIRGQCHAITEDKLTIFVIKTNDTWVRDFGPQYFAKQGLDLQFNAWGNQYPCALDAAFAENFHQQLCSSNKAPYLNIQAETLTPSQWTLEGGNLEFNGAGTVLFNYRCVLRNNPHLNLSEEQVSQQLCQQFSLQQALSVDVPALTGDDTGGHIDTLARFIDEKHIVYAKTHQTKHADTVTLAKLEQDLKRLAATHDLQLTAVNATATTLYNAANNIVPASYLNFLFINDALLLPLYNLASDAAVLAQFQQLLPQRKIIGIDATALIEQFGSIHCATLHLTADLFKMEGT